MNYNHQAIFNLYPTVVCIDDGIGAMDKDGNLVPIVQSDYETEIARLQAEQDATQYQRDRKYPPIGDQLDALFHAGVFPEEMAAQLQAVKDAHPKP